MKGKVVLASCNTYILIHIHIDINLVLVSPNDLMTFSSFLLYCIHFLCTYVSIMYACKEVFPNLTCLYCKALWGLNVLNIYKLIWPDLQWLVFLPCASQSLPTGYKQVKCADSFEALTSHGHFLIAAKGALSYETTAGIY